MRSFNSRETYLAAVSAWKLEHAEQIKLIRKLKLDFKAAQRVFAKHGPYQYSWAQPQKTAWHNDYLPMEDVRSQKLQAAQIAINLVLERHHMKFEAHRQYLAQKR